MTGQEALESLIRCFEETANSSVIYDQAQAFRYAAGCARQKLAELMEYSSKSS